MTKNTCEETVQNEANSHSLQNSRLQKSKDIGKLTGSKGKMADVQSKSSDWYTNLKNELGGEKLQSLLQRFATCTTETERVQLIYELPEINNVIKVQARKKAKSAEQCVGLREQGNKVFQDRKFRKALELFNQSVQLAPVTADDKPLLALALANRSAALLFLKQYQLCLADIQAAFKNGYPQETAYKLQEREGKCYYQLHQRDKAITSLELAIAGAEASDLPNDKKTSLKAALQKQVKQCKKLDKVITGDTKKVDNSIGHGPLPHVKGKCNSTIPVLTEQATVAYSATSGRGLVAKQDLEIGDVVVVENPYTSTLLPDFAGSHCHHCCRRVVATTPCLECSEAAFCDEDCRQAAWDSYHRYECDVLDSVREADVSLGHLSLKMVLKAGFTYVDEYMEKVGIGSVADPKSLGRNKDGVYDSADYRTVYTLMNHTDSRKTDDVLKYCLSAVYLLKSLEQTSYFHDDVVPVSKKAVVGGHILRHLQMLPCNAHEVSELGVNRKNLPASVTIEIGSAIYPVLSLINHSCDPNVVRHSYGDTCVVRAIRNIPKGGEILDNYGTLCALTPCEERRRKLEPQYFFTCGCQACVDDFSLYQDLPTDIPVFKCAKCSGPVFLPLQGAPSSLPCSFCKEIHDLTTKVSSLAAADEIFRAAMMEVLTNEKMDVDKQIPALENYLQMLDHLVLRPWRDFNDCQEVLKQCYALNGAHFPISVMN